jgi:serine/threonine protein kinase
MHIVHLSLCIFLTSLQLVFDHECWTEASPECGDFIRGCLQKDPNARITVADAMNHAWFAPIRDEFGDSWVTD